MWRSDKNKGPSKLLPPSSQQFAHAKADRDRNPSYFRELYASWKPVVRKPVEPETPPPIPNDPNLPAWLRHRPTNNTGQKLFFRTKAAVTRSKPKK